jgi:hypothetical protein
LPVDGRAQAEVSAVSRVGRLRQASGYFLVAVHAWVVAKPTSTQMSPITTVDMRGTALRQRPVSLQSGSGDGVHMAEDKVPEKDFNLHRWFATIPMTDDVYLGLQAQNIARVEMSVMRPHERKALDEQHADPGSFQGPTYRELMALSQMWIFGVYEFLRTWRQRATKLIGHEEKLNSLVTQEDRDAYLREITDEAKRRGRRVENAPIYYPDHVAKVSDAAFMKSVRDY